MNLVKALKNKNHSNQNRLSQNRSNQDRPKQNRLGRQKAFTLIEMMVSISLFSIVLLVVMGSIITVIDVNRKSQTLSNVMNDVNFALESINRSVVTGDLKDADVDPAYRTIDGKDSQIGLVDQNGNGVVYKLITDDGRGYIQRVFDSDPNNTSNQEVVALTSKEVDIKTLEFQVFDDDDNMQPRVLVLIEGEARTARDISSSFRIQTSIGQRNLDTADLYN